MEEMMSLEQFVFKIKRVVELLSKKDGERKTERG